MRVLSIAAVLVLSACAAKATPEADPAAGAQPPPSVRITSVRAEPYAPVVRGTGRLIDAQSGELGFAVGGVLVGLEVDEGDRVRKGQVLARLDAEPFAAQQAQAEATLDKARRDQGRATALRGEGAVPQAPVDDATTGVAVADATLRLARFQRARAVLVAPTDGVVLHRLADVGEVVGPGQPIVSLSTGRKGARAAKDDARVVRVGLVDRDVVRLALGDSAQVRIDALPDRVLEGRVTWMAAVPQPQTGLFDVEVSVDAGDTPLPPQRGLVTRVELKPAAQGERVRLPLEALVEVDAGRAQVWVVDSEGRARSRAVELGRVESDGVWVRDGLSAGERVVVAGLERVVPDAAVRIADAGAP
jgi:RND family efflux transporter MFP subunit